MFSEQHTISVDQPSALTFYPIINPNQIKYEIPASPNQLAFINNTRKEISDVLNDIDDRLILVMGPCSIHNYEQALSYARLLCQQGHKHIKELCILMRLSFENPCNTFGWKGYINDPQINGSIDIELGLKMARKLLIDIVDLGLPVATEISNLYSHHFIGDLVSWASIDTRNTESQCHREMVSGLSFPIGFNSAKNCDIKVAVDALVTAMTPHSFMSVNAEGKAAIFDTLGNKDVHLILRYGQQPHFSATDFDQAYKELKKVDISQSMMVDVSNTKSRKDHLNQIELVQNISKQISIGDRRIIGMMIKSFIKEGSQEISDGNSLEYGVSITDTCISFDQTIPLLEELAKAVTLRRLA